MRRYVIAALVVSLPLLGVSLLVAAPRSTTAQSPEPSAFATITDSSPSATPTGENTATPASEDTVVPEATPTAFVFPTPHSDVLSTSGSISGRVLQDVNGNGIADSSDTGAETLVDIIGSPEQPGTSLLTAQDGSFEVRGLAPRTYGVMIWWSPGFIGETSLHRPSLFVSALDVSSDGTVRGYLPDVLLGEPIEPGINPYPVRSGGAAPIPGGFVDLGGHSSPVGLPATGTTSQEGQWWQPVVIVLICFLGAAIVAVTIGRRFRGDTPRR